MPVKSKARTKKGKRKAMKRIIKEFKKGKTFKHTQRKFGTARAKKQAIAIALKATGRSKKRRK